jgi:MoxR-like ATPase
VARLRDAQLAAARFHQGDTHANAAQDNPVQYVRFGVLGEAFQQEQRTVVLIDEIDKADIDFPNDLLLELDEQWFAIEEVKTDDGSPLEIKAKQPPIVFITSNDEKDLPDAFLRRCLFHYITFPELERLIAIVNLHFPSSSDALVDASVNRFLELRQTMREDKGAAAKKVSTSELIDWFRVLRRYPEDEVLAKLERELPYPSVLLKSWDDHRRYLSVKGREGIV